MNLNSIKNVDSSLYFLIDKILYKSNNLGEDLIKIADDISSFTVKSDEIYELKPYTKPNWNIS